MPLAITEHQLPHLANGVFQCLRGRWRIQSTDLSPSRINSVNTATIPQPGSHERIIINSQAALHIHEPHDHVGPLHHLAIQIDASMHNDFLHELTPQQAHEWTEAVQHDSSIYTLWRYRPSRQTWRPHEALPTSVPHTGIKLTKWLLTSRSIWALTPEQREQYENNRKKAGPARESIVDIIEQAVEAALG